MKETIYDCTVLDVEVESNGFCGGDAGHRGKTKLYFSFSGEAFEVLNSDKECIAFNIRGDSELFCMHEALKFAINALEYYEPKLKEGKKYYE